MIIVVEGLDGVGKTTVVDYFSEKYDITKYRCLSFENYKVPKHCVNKGYEEIVISDMMSKIKIDGSIVFDRSLISSYVYNCVFKHDRTIRQEDMENNLYVWAYTLNYGVNSPLHIIRVLRDKGHAVADRSGIFKRPGNVVKNRNKLLLLYNYIFDVVLDGFDITTVHNDGTIDELHSKLDNVWDSFKE